MDQKSNRTKFDMEPDRKMLETLNTQDHLKANLVGIFRCCMFLLLANGKVLKYHLIRGSFDLLMQSAHITSKGVSCGLEINISFI